MKYFGPYFGVDVHTANTLPRGFVLKYSDYKPKMKSGQPTLDFDNKMSSWTREDIPKEVFGVGITFMKLNAHRRDATFKFYYVMLTDYVEE